MKHRQILLHHQGPLFPPADKVKKTQPRKDKGAVRAVHKNKIIVEPETARAIVADIDSGQYTQLGVAAKYGYSRAVIRRVLKTQNIEVSIS